MPVKRRASGSDRYVDVLNALGKVRLEGRPVIELFTEIPDAGLYPDYREVVSSPLSLAEINKRVKVGAYDSDDSLIADFELMAENARAYNGEESPVFDDATDLLDFVLLYCGRELSRSSRQRLQMAVLDELEAYKVKGRKLSDAFMVEPNVKTYPNYLDIVKNPTSFAKVRQQLATGPQPNWAAFKQLAGEIFSNAIAYNQEGSPICLDAKALAKQLDAKVAKHSQVPKHLAAALPRSVMDELEGPEETVAAASAAVPARASTGRPRGRPKKRGRGRPRRDESDSDGSSSSEDEEMPAAVALRFDDDDDEDFEADSEDFEEEDMEEGGDQSNERGDMPVVPGVGPLPPQFFHPSEVYDEIVYRAPDEGANDALVRMVTCHSKPIPPDVAVSLPIEDVKRAETDILQLRIPPSASKVFTTYATTLPYYQSTLRLAVLPNSAVQPLQVTVLMNGATLIPNPSTSEWDNYELSLAPGLNQVSVVAIKGTYGGYLRQVGPPPLAEAEADEERIVLFLNLSK